MEATPSLVVRVAGNGRWKGKIEKWNFTGFYLVVWLRLFVGHPFQNLIKHQSPQPKPMKPNPIIFLAHQHQSPHPKPMKPNPITYQAHQWQSPCPTHTFYLSIHYSNNNYHSTKVIKHSNPHPYPSYTPIPLTHPYLLHTHTPLIHPYLSSTPPPSYKRKLLWKIHPSTY